jgi:hypothetical protein
MSTISAEEARKRKAEVDRLTAQLSGVTQKQSQQVENKSIYRDLDKPMSIDDFTPAQQADIENIPEVKTRSDMSKPPSSQEMSGNQRANMLMEASKGLQNATKGNSGQTDSTSSAANMALSTGMSGASIAAMSGATGAQIAGAGGAAAGAGVAIGLIQAAAARRQARNALENQKQLKLIEIEDSRSNRIQNALQSMASNMGQTLRSNQQIRL